MRRVIATVLLLSAAAGNAQDATTRPADAPKPDNPRVTPVVLAYRKARPAVVNISADRVVTARYGFGGFRGDPFGEVFPFPDVFSRPVPVKSIGSGFIIHPRGYAVTNAHVVSRAQRISVTTPDGEEYAARVISADPENDLAVLKVKLPEGETLPHLPLGGSDDLMVGETVIAIGNPMGYANTLTKGVISGIDRTLAFRGGVRFTGIIQTDAPINPGNSGGPLLNIRGELIGVTTAIRGDAQNIGFAIPVDALARELSALLDFERINRVVFGASVIQRHLNDGDAVFVEKVRPGSPADGKLRPGDRILALNGLAVRQIPEFTCAMLEVEPGRDVRLTCVRGGKRVRVTVPVLARPKPDGKALARALFGLTMRPITRQLARDLRLPVDKGLLVVGVDVGSPAHKLGLALKDVLFQVDRYYLTDLDDLGAALEEVRPGDVLRLGIVRGNEAIWAPLRTRKPPATRPAALPEQGTEP